MLNQVWFTPRLRGFGVDTVTWEGRVLLAGFVLALMVLVVFPAIRSGRFYWGRLLVMMTIVFGIAYFKTGSSGL